MACVGFPLRWLLSTGSEIAGSVAVVHLLSFPHGMWSHPGAGTEPVSPALVARFLTIGPPGKSWSFNSKNPAITHNWLSKHLLSKLEPVGEQFAHFRIWVLNGRMVSYPCQKNKSIYMSMKFTSDRFLEEELFETEFSGGRVRTRTFFM